MLPLGLLATAEQRPFGWRAGRRARPARRLLGSPAAVTTLGTAAIAELVVDKRPTTPSRLEPASIGARLLSGALSGAAVAAAAREPIRTGAIVGASGAMAGAFAGYFARRWAARATRTPDLGWALAEDAAAFALSFWSLRSQRIA
jgi:uncharacterized membrane protein